MSCISSGPTRRTWIGSGLRQPATEIAGLLMAHASEDERRVIPLGIYSRGWSDGEIGHEIKTYAPRLFTYNRSMVQMSQFSANSKQPRQRSRIGLAVLFGLVLVVGILGAIDNAKYIASSAFTFKGSIELSGGQISQAVSDLTTAISIDNQNVMAYTERAASYEAMKKWDAGVADYSRVIELDPANGMAYLWRGQIYLMQEDLEKALFDSEQAVRFLPANERAYWLRGSVYYHQGNIKAALTDINKAIQLDPSGENGDLYLARSHIYYDMRNYTEAIQDVSRALQIKPDSADSYYARALCVVTPESWTGGDLSMIVQERGKRNGQATEVRFGVQS